MPDDFPPGEVGQPYNRVGELAKGEFVYVRMQVFRTEPSDRDSLQCVLAMPAASSSFSQAYQVLCVPRSQIVCREPRAMEADEGVVRGIE